MWPSETAMVLAGWLCVFLAAVSAQSGIEIYKKVGNDVVLKSGQSGTITNIMWKHGQNIAVQWDGSEVDRYRQFKERGSLNISTGDLTITGLTENDSGLYTPEINNMLKTATRLIIISPVPKPGVSKSCDNEMTSCTLSCDGDTTGAEPATYSWKSDDKVLGSSKEQQITKDSSSSVTEFSCELLNPVSKESSAPLSNPFIIIDPPAGNLNISTGVTVFISLLIAVLLLVAIHRCKAGMWFFEKSSMPWTADFWRKNESSSRDAAEYNGMTFQGKGEADEETPMT